MVNEAYPGVRGVQTINETGVYAHSLSIARIGRRPMRGASTIRAAMKLENPPVPDIDIRGAFAPLEYHVIARIVRPEHPEPTADRAIALEDF